MDISDKINYNGGDCMDVATIQLLCTVVCCGLAAASFWRSGNTDNAKESERWGAFNKEMEYVRKDLDEIKNLVGQNSRDTKDSIRRVHDRLDEHLRKEHNQTVPKRSG